MSGQEHSEHVKLALLAINARVRDGLTIDVPQEIPCELTERRAGAFVSLHTHGRLRGCIGTIEPTTPSLAQEIISNAISAATRDPRFMPLAASELDDLECSVDVLGMAEEIIDMRQLDPKKYGVIVESGRKRGLLLPDLEGVDTIADQVDIAMKKAMIRSTEAMKIYRFEVVRHY